MDLFIKFLVAAVLAGTPLLFGTVGEIVSENVFRYMTLSRSASAKSVSVGFAETENSES